MTLKEILTVAAIVISDVTRDEEIFRPSVLLNVHIITVITMVIAVVMLNGNLYYYQSCLHTTTVDLCHGKYLRPFRRT